MNVCMTKLLLVFVREIAREFGDTSIDCGIPSTRSRANGFSKAGVLAAATDGSRELSS